MGLIKSKGGKGIFIGFMMYLQFETIYNFIFFHD